MKKIAFWITVFLYFVASSVFFFAIVDVTFFIGAMTVVVGVAGIIVSIIFFKKKRELSIRLFAISIPAFVWGVLGLVYWIGV
jgi:hypothetical protein